MDRDPRQPLLLDTEVPTSSARRDLDGRLEMQRDLHPRANSIALGFVPPSHASPVGGPRFVPEVFEDAIVYALLPFGRPSDFHGGRRLRVTPLWTIRHTEKIHVEVNRYASGPLSLPSVAEVPPSAGS